jgi:hypothetical protein
VQVVQLRNWKDVVQIQRAPCTAPTWYIIARDTAKLGAK